VTSDAGPDGTPPEPAQFAPDDRPTGIDDVEVAVFDGEAVLFDVRASMVHHLNAVPAATWLCCDGETSIAEMLDELADTFGLGEPADIAALAAAVYDSLSRFAAEGLLVGRPSAARITMTPVPTLAADGTEILTAPDDP